MGHQRAPEGGHLLLAPRGVAGERAAPLLQLRKVAVHPSQVLLELRAARAARVGPSEEILLDREMRETVAPFHHLHYTAPHQLIGAEPVHASTAEFDRSLGDLAAL